MRTNVVYGIASPLPCFRVPYRREYSANILNGTSVVKFSIVKLSSTNVKLDTAQTSISISIGGKLEETLTTHRKVQCAMWMRTRVWIMCHLRQELGTCGDCKPISFVRTLKTSLREKGACSVMVSASNLQADGPGLIHADAAADLIYLI